MGDDAGRDRMISELAEGATSSVEEASQNQQQPHEQSLLIRGCDPEMARRAKPMLRKHLGPKVNIHSATDDTSFFELLGKQKWDVVLFAPGACRWSRSGELIPGQDEKEGTSGWRVADYYSTVEDKQKGFGGQAVKIVETCEEKEIVPKLQQALHL